MSYEQIIKDLASKKYSPVYFLHGEEPYYIDKIADYITKNVLTETEQSFNQTILYGKDTDAHSIIGIARRFPMMSTHQVVIVREAQGIGKIDGLEPYLDNPLKSTILVICYKYKKLDGRTNFSKKIKKYTEFKSEKIREYHVQNWIASYVKTIGKEIDNKAANLLVEFLGNDLGKIVGEIEKLSIVMKSKGVINITPDLIEENIGISKDYNIFELQKAIITKDVLKANKIVKYFSANPKDHNIVPVISIIGGFFIKLLLYHYLPVNQRNEFEIMSKLKIGKFAVKDYQLAAQKYNANKAVVIISLFREYDMKSKGVEDTGTESSELLKELIFKIIHV